jgi:hypothetical protein
VAQGFPKRKVPGRILIDTPRSPDGDAHLVYIRQRLNHPEVTVYEELLERGYSTHNQPEYK